MRFRWKPNSVAMWDNRSTQHYAVMDYPPCHRKMERAGIIGDAAVLIRALHHLHIAIKDHTMNFLDGSLFPENQDKLVITAAPYGPEWIPSDFPEDIPVTMEAQIQKAVDCYNAGATVLHLHVRELDGKGSKRLSKFNELIAGVRKAVPDMIIQVGGSISFAPETDGAAAKWLSDDTRHMLAELDPKPDQVTVTVNTTQMNVVEQMEIDGHRRHLAGRAGELPGLPRDDRALRRPSWVEEHVRRLSAAGIQSAFQFYNINSYETVERLIRRGVYKGPLVMNWVAIGGGMDQPTIYSLANFLRAIPDGSMLTVESSMRNVLPINMMGMAMGLHVRCGIEDNLWNQSRTGKMTHGAADRAAGAHLARVRPRDRHRQGSARDLQDRRVLRHRRGDAGRQRLRAQRQGPAAGLPAQGGLRSMRMPRRRPS